jgi:hypothetical protein
MKTQTDNGGTVIKMFLKELTSAFDGLSQKLKKMDFPEGLLYYEYPVACSGKFLRLGVEIKSGKFYLQGDGINGEIQTLVLL